jgi:Fe-S-cluster containining protein
VVELMPGDDDIPDDLVVEHSGIRCMDQRGDGACVALDPDTKLCRIYERRPITCRNFMRGETLCLKAIARFVPASP